MVSVPGEASDHTGLFLLSCALNHMPFSFIHTLKTHAFFFYPNSCSKMKGKNACLLSFCIYVFFFFYQIVSK